MDELHRTFHLSTLTVLVLHLFLSHVCQGQSELIGSSQPIVATLGGDVVLPCYLQPAIDATDLTVEWTRPDLNPRFVHVRRYREELVDKKHESFQGRTSLFIDELTKGNISLTISKVKLSDEGKYRCFIPALGKETFVQLRVVQPELIGSSQPILSTLGGDVVLPCYLQPAVDATDLTVEWTRPDLNPRFVHVRRYREELVDKKHESFEGRTSLFTDELTKGNISLKLCKVKLSDEGKYKCFIPALGKETFVQLRVAPVSSPVISLSGMDRDRGGVVLQCESRGWYPEPEVLWLDAEGNLLSAGPPETVRGPDDLYTVSSRVTVDKRHNNSFTCRVQQNNTHQTREAHIHVPDDFFSSAVPNNTGLVVSLAVSIMVILACVFFVWRQNRTKTKKRSRDEAEKEKLLGETKDVRDKK
ncbi:butyrophilin subfamily 3 member A2-like [Mugil cephalus]|uniref:butyrophilin subfamily 3 member A2-like n=1 Tax=Mugil cephalus TaxID=48193 RepID=UPI001FB8421E|nr:butyrophilin subfamily 3 member A2-like [Mugil cephalus]